MNSVSVWWKVICGLVMAWGSTGPGYAQPREFAEPWKRPDAVLVRQGRFVFGRHCATCHGRLGDGRGEMAEALRPRPRDFRTGIFKYRSTPSGMLPTLEDLERTIRGGVAGTAMPMFKDLPEKDLKALIAFIMSRSPKWRQPGHHAPPLTIPPLPAWFGDSLAGSEQAAQGGRLFEVTCAPCHGPKGDGRGAVAGDLTDAWGQPAVMPDLRSGVWRSGSRPEDLYRVLVTGLNGTPMPSFLEGTTEEQRWQLVAYLVAGE